MSTIKYTAGVRVHVHVHVHGHVHGRPLGPLGQEDEEDWFPGRVLDAHVLAGRARYIVLLDDDRRLVAHEEHVRSHPPRRWAEAAMAEALEVAS